jgi:PAS domain S-box-containing protein
VRLLVVSRDAELVGALEYLLEGWRACELRAGPDPEGGDDGALAASACDADAVIVETVPHPPGRTERLVTACLSQAPATPVLLLDRKECAEEALAAMRAGATDCLWGSGLTASALCRALSNALDKAAMQRQLYLRDLLLDSVEEAVFTVDHQWRITSMNRSAERVAGTTRERALGSRCGEVFAHSLCAGACPMQGNNLADDAVAREGFAKGRDAHRREVPFSVKTAPLRDGSGRVIGGLEVIRDLSVVEGVRRAARDRHTFADMIGKSRPMQELFESLPPIARSDATVLISGASGTGKELVARALHGLSPRGAGPLVAINCAALPDGLLESELFGYRAGAFTGAYRDKPGRLAAAEGGTLLLDEIGELSPEMQTKLLRVLEERTYEPLGAVQPVHADVRVFAATNRDLEGAVRAGRFRKDLFYRLRVIQVELPSLRERIEDVPLLAQAFREEFCLLQGKTIYGFSEAAMVRLLEHHYPGNVRELRNVVEHAVTICEDQRIDVGHLPRELRGTDSQGAERPCAGRSPLRRLERAYLEELLRRHHGSRADAARELGVHPTTLYRKIRSLGVAVPEADGRRRGSGRS